MTISEVIKMYRIVCHGELNCVLGVHVRGREGGKENDWRMMGSGNDKEAEEGKGKI